MNRITGSKGFTLVELLIVVAIIGVLAAIVVPQLMRSKAAANEKAVIASMRGIANGQALRLNEKDKFGTLEELKTENYSDVGSPLAPAGAAPGVTVTFEKAGYDWDAVTSVNRQTWSVRAKPKQYDVTGKKCFYIDQSGVVRSADGAGGGFAAGATSPALQ